MIQRLNATAKRIIAMSFSRSKAEDRITDLSEELTIHIVKLLLYPSSTDVKGWKKEIRNWLFQSSEYGNNLKGGHKLKEKDYFEFMSIFIRSEAAITVRKDIVISSMSRSKLQPNEIDDHTLFEYMHDLFKRISAMLSKGPDLSEIDSLVNTIKLKDDNGITGQD